MMNHKETLYGDSGAAVFLAKHMKEVGDKNLRRKVTRTINHNKKYVNELTLAYSINAISTECFICSLNNYRKSMFVCVGNALASNLIRNVLVADIRKCISWAKDRTQNRKQK